MVDIAHIARLAFATLSSMLLASSVHAYGDTQWEWRSSAIPDASFPTKAAALAATKALGNGYQHLDSEKGVAAANAQWLQYEYSVSPRQPIVFSDWRYVTGSFEHETEATAYAFVYDNIATNYSHPSCPPELNPRTGWVSFGQMYGISVGEQKTYDDIRFWWDETQGCYRLHEPPLTYYMQRVREAGCPAGFFFSAGECVNTATALISSRPLVCGPSTPNPCDVANGSKTLVENDYSGAVPFTRTYHSQIPQSLAQVGIGWTHSYFSKLVVSSDPTAWLREDGYHEPLMSRGTYVNGVWQAHWVSLTGSDIRIERDGTGYRLHKGSGEQWLFEASGELVKIVKPSGAQLFITRDSNGRVTAVNDDFGHELHFSYLPDTGLLAAVTLTGTTLMTYEYDAERNLRSVAYADGRMRKYVYEEPNLPNHLTGVIDESDARFKTADYDSLGRVVSSELANGIERITLQYAATTTTVNPVVGESKVYTFTNDANLHRRLTSMSEGAITRTWQVPPYWEDPLRRVTEESDGRGIITRKSYDTDHLTSVVEAYGTGHARSRTYSYFDEQSELPVEIDGGLRRIEFVRDSYGRVLVKTMRDLSSNESRAWTFTYNSFGQVLTADGPRADVSDVTRYAYYNCNTGYQCGQVQTITNALGHITTYNTYSAHGQPLTITDPNDVVTTLTYDLRQRLTSRTVGAESTSFEYWPTGLLKKAILPDGSYLEYTYDAAHRLTSINDAQGNRIAYTLDAMGNRTKEDVFDGSLVLSRTRTQVFNALNQLSQQIGAAGTPNVTTEFGYDSNGNQTSIVAPLARNTTQAYDELNRLASVADPGAGLTEYGYDALDQLISVTDPRGLATTYSYNGLGDLKEQASPDTGTTTNTYDSGGNLKTSTNARGIITTYTYDALDRIQSAAFKLGTTTDQTISYNYDAGTNGKGRLTSASDASHSMAWTYDAQGRVTGKSQVIGSVTQSVGYGYLNGQLTAITTPSGQTITYGYANNQITSLQVNGASVLSNVVYEPFGPPKQWTWANGTQSSRTYDQDGKVTQITGPVTTTYGYDDAFRITGITDTTNSALSWLYGYDNLDRLTSASKTGTTLGYTYDANGNRLSQTGTSASTYTIAANSNRVTATSGVLNRTYGYNADGNINSYTGISYQYNNRGRIKSSTKNNVTTNYTYNALSELVKKSTGLYVYDEAGHVLGQYTTSGVLTSEIVWLGDTPVATIRPASGGGVEVFYIHTDHLNTPRVVTQPSNNAQRWRWDSNPFGSTANDNPSGLGVFTLDLRFPGQIAMPESGLYQNYFRDYDYQTGRYLQSDPIGVAGGLNTYRYSFNDPMSYFDPYGLDAEVGVRKFFPVPVPYARHCFIRFNQNDNDTLSFDDKGVHVDPNPKGADMSPTIGKENDSCVREKMKECKGSQYDFLDFNCCMCASNALHACGLKKQGPWPNAPRDASNPPYKPEVPKPDPKNPPKK